MDSFDIFKNRIAKYGAVLMVIIEIVSLPIIGFSLKFALGLLLGTVISIVNLYLLAYQCKQVIMEGNKFISVWGYILRLFLFGAVLVICIKISLPCGVGAILGILTTKVSMAFITMKSNKVSTDNFKHEDTDKDSEEKI